MKKIACFLFSVLIIRALTACGSTPAASTATATEKPTITAMDTTVPTATNTSVPPLEGKLFFDMNGSGLQDEASFTFDPTRLADSRQPLQLDLANAVNDFVSTHSNLKNGDLITIQEPGLSGFTVCVQSECVQTDGQGNFLLPNTGGASSVSITITDPNAGTPALAMRHINQWNRTVVFPSYEMNGIQVPEQHLNDTIEIPIENAIDIKAGTDINIGLMQGFLRSPFPEGFPAYIQGFFDIDGRYPWDRNGTVHNYLGDTYNWADGNPFSSVDSDKINRSSLIFPGVSGTEDGHDGIDIRMNLLTPIVATIPGKVIKTYWENGQDILIDNFIGNVNYRTFYGHLDKRVVVTPEQIVYPGQIIGFSSNTGEGNNGIPALHFSLIKIGIIHVADYAGDTLIDPFRKVAEGHFPLESDVSYWIIDNLLNPQQLGFDPAKIIIR